MTITIKARQENDIESFRKALTDTVQGMARVKGEGQARPAL